MYCTKDIVRLLSQTGSPVILVFLTLRAYRTPRGTPSVGREIHGVGKFYNFRLKSLFISEVVRDRPMFVIEHQ